MSELPAAVTAHQDGVLVPGIELQTAFSAGKTAFTSAFTVAFAPSQVAFAPLGIQRFAL